MSTLDMVIVAWACGLGLGGLFGYWIPKLYASSVAKAVERERVVAALAGQKLPGWEETARELEAAAVKHAKMGATLSSHELLQQAAEVRAIGRKSSR